MDMYEVFAPNPLLAILRNVPEDITLDYAGAILKGGVKVFEVALNSPDALAQISMLRKAYGDQCLIGAGTAITVERAQAALDAGAQFLLTPGTPVDVFEFCQSRDVMLLPGVMTPTDVAVSLQYGFKTMKLFPAGDLPRSYIKDLKGPFDDTNYIAIGGVTPENIPEFIASGCLSVGLASSLMPKDKVKTRDWDACAEYVHALAEKAKR